MNFKQIKSRIKKLIVLQYYFGLLKKTIDENLVFFESKKGADLAGNILAILQELQKPEYRHLNVYLTAKKAKMSQINELLEAKKIHNVTIIRMGSFKYYGILAKAKYLIFDTSSVLSYIKKPGQVIINTWHGTPLKHMGKYLPTKENPFGNVQRNLQMADYLVYPNVYMKNIMFDAYCLEKSYTGKVLMTGYPRNAIFFDKNVAENIRNAMGNTDKKMYVYMPTWRGVLSGSKNKQVRVLQKMLVQLEQILDPNIEIYVKLHPFVSAGIKYDELNKIKPFPKGMDTYELLNASDGLITDYSSVFFDYVNTRKKIVLWAYDEEKYMNGRGTYLKLSDMPFPVVKEVEELALELNKDKQYDDVSFMKEFGYCDCPNATEKLCQRVFLGTPLPKEEEIDYAKRNNKENVLLYVSTLAMNGMTTSLLSLLERLNLNEKNYFAVYRETSRAKTAVRFDILPKEVDYLPICSDEYSLSELIYYGLYHKLNIRAKFVKKHVDRIFKREIKRLYGSLKIDHAIQFTGYESHIIHLFENMNANRVIIVHNDMVQEVEVKGNQHRLTLQAAYRNYDHVGIVTEDLRNATKQLGATDDKIILTPNCHAHETVVKRGMEEIKFQSYTETNVTEEELEKILSEDGYKFINIGRFSYEKGQDMLIRAFERFYQDHNTAKLIIIGGYGKEYAKIKQMVSESPASKNIVMIRQMNNPMPVLKRCDLFVLSSRYEGFGLVLLEANSLGVPVMSTRITGPTGFMEEHGGYLTEPTEDGILLGLNDFVAGKIKALEIDYEKYNQNAVAHFMKVFQR